MDKQGTFDNTTDKIKETAVKYYTYADYEKLDDDNRYELIDGVIYMMSSPTTAHQEISGELFSQLHDFLRGKSCKVFSAPFDVRLSDDDVVVPDLAVICDKRLR